MGEFFLACLILGLGFAVIVLEARVAKLERRVKAMRPGIYALYRKVYEKK
jgi:hypothetical protein